MSSATKSNFPSFGSSNGQSKNRPSTFYSAPAALQLLLKDIRDEALSSPSIPNPCRLTHASLLAELSRAWQFDNAKIVVQWMTLVRAAAERPLQTFLPAAFFRVPAPPSSSTLAAGETAADDSGSSV